MTGEALQEIRCSYQISGMLSSSTPVSFFNAVKLPKFRLRRKDGIDTDFIRRMYINCNQHGEIFLTRF